MVTGHTGHFRGKEPMRSPSRHVLVRHKYVAERFDARGFDSVNSLAIRLGLPLSQVQHWVVCGWLKASWNGTRYLLTEGDVMDFLADPRSIPYADADSILDKGLRSWTRGAREDSPWATVAEAARLAGYHKSYVVKLASKGHIRRIRFPHAWLCVVNKDDLIAYVRRVTVR